MTLIHLGHNMNAAAQTYYVYLAVLQQHQHCHIRTHPHSHTHQPVHLICAYQQNYHTAVAETRQTNSHWY